MRWLALAVVILAGCPICDCNNELAIVRGQDTVRLGEQILLELDNEGYRAGPGRCRGHWYVDEVEFGNSEVGTITKCGLYTAPFRPPRPRPFKVRIDAGKYELYGCADCCPTGTRTLTIVD